jgi:Galactose oxidase, central domain/Kelch motif
MTQLNDMNVAKASHAVCLVERKIYACAGSSDIEDSQKTFEYYDINLNLWNRLPDCHFPALRSLLVPLDEKYIYKFGGTSADGTVFKDIECYDIREKEWTIISDPVIRAEPELLKRLQFKFMAMMCGVQVNHNSILVEIFLSRYSVVWTQITIHQISPSS